jgi:hypothetical protein
MELPRLGSRLIDGHSQKITAAAKGCAATVAVRVRKADEKALELASVIDDVTAAGHGSFASIAEELNRRGIQTPRQTEGHKWHASSVRNLRARIDRLTAAHG